MANGAGSGAGTESGSDRPHHRFARWRRHDSGSVAGVGGARAWSGARVSGGHEGRDHAVCAVSAQGGARWQPAQPQRIGMAHVTRRIRLDAGPGGLVGGAGGLSHRASPHQTPRIAAEGGGTLGQW
ncbi:MAG: hypothetical protein C0453_20605 [Comamonadaceae bacterium]|nr:hypothetical protein [Comamonadaceae bacterium]